MALDALVGLGKDQLRAALGPPHTCEEDSVGTADGRRLPVAPCQTHSDWFYSFYHLPETSLGGGPELFLTFGPNGRVARAEWQFTR